jgi:hypothetical protein
MASDGGVDVTGVRWSGVPTRLQPCFGTNGGPMPSGMHDTGREKGGTRTCAAGLGGASPDPSGEPPGTHWPCSLRHVEPRPCLNRGAHGGISSQAGRHRLRPARTRFPPASPSQVSRHLPVVNLLQEHASSLKVALPWRSPWCGPARARGVATGRLLSRGNENPRPRTGGLANLNPRVQGSFRRRAARVGGATCAQRGLAEPHSGYRRCSGCRRCLLATFGSSPLSIVSLQAGIAPAHLVGILVGMASGPGRAWAV